MISRARYIVIVVIIAATLVAVSLWVVPFVRGIWPAVDPAAPIPSSSPLDDIPATGPLTAPDGWEVSILSDRVPGARDMVTDFQGNIWVSQPSRGTVSLITLDANGKPINISAVIKDIGKPHGLAFDPENPTHLYIAGETEIYRILTYSDAEPEKIADVPRGDRHTTRSIVFGPDGRLYISIGSSCDACHELNKEHGSVISMNTDGTDRRIIATGLRNAVFMTLHDGQLVVTEMGRDNLGDDVPPDEINIIPLDTNEPDVRNYGWPICYGDGVHDTDFDKNQYVRDPCEDTVSPSMNLQAHVAPLGLAFIPQTAAWPADWRGDLFVAYHGSWNRAEPVGYKVVAFDTQDDTPVPGSERNVITGFLVGASALGRPVDVLPTEDGILYVSDDKAGIIWKMERTK